MLLALLLLSWSTPATEGDHTLRNFAFTSGGTLPELRMHYRTLGTLRRNAQGQAENAVLVLHGTGGSGEAFLKDTFAGQLFGAGQPLDASRYFLILPDNLGHGKSSKPSDGLLTRFPQYGYRDMVAAQRALLREKLGVDRLRLVIGTSMGCMHAWLWGTRYPDEVEALMPLACLPHAISGRNLIWRQVLVDAIRNDPGYRGGNYKAQPAAMRTFHGISLVMGSNTLDLQKKAPARAEAKALYERLMSERMARAVDANDTLYQFESSWDYDPSADLEKITAAVFAVNFADDPINPAELGIFERELKRVRRAQFLLHPATTETRGHSTHSLPQFWKAQLEQLMREPGR